MLSYTDKKILNSLLTIAAAGSKRVVNNVTSFAGTLTTQSISGTLNVYNATLLMLEAQLKQKMLIQMILEK